MTGIGRSGKTNKHNPKGCKGCKYRSKTMDWCNYGEIMKKSRLVTGGKLYPNGGCSLYERGNPMTRSGGWTFGENGQWRQSVGDNLKENPKNSKADFELIKKLYEAGLADERIAEKAKCNYKTVAAWRKRNGLESNFFLRKRDGAAHGK